MQRCSTSRLVSALLPVLLILATLPACKSQKHYDDSLGEDLLTAVSARAVEKTRSLLDRHANPNTLAKGGDPILFAVLLSMTFDMGEVVSGQISATGSRLKQLRSSSSCLTQGQTLTARTSVDIRSSWRPLSGGIRTLSPA